MKQLKDISNSRSFNPRLFNHEVFNPGLLNHDFLNHGNENFRVEKSGVEILDQLKESAKAKKLHNITQTWILHEFSLTKSSITQGPSVFIVVFSGQFVRISGDFSSIFGHFEAKLLSMSIYGFTSY